MSLERKYGSLSMWFLNSWYKFKRVFSLSYFPSFLILLLLLPVWAGGEQTSRQRVSCSNPRSKSADRNSQLTPVAFEISSNVYRRSSLICSPILFDILVGTTCWRAPRMRMIFNAHFSSYEPRKPLENLCTAQCFLLKGLLKHFICFCGRFSETKTKSQADSLFGTVRHHDSTSGAWQHLGELTTQARTTFYGDVRWLQTFEGCNYTHLAGKHSTTIRKSSPKSVRVFWVRPRTQTVTITLTKYQREVYIFKKFNTNLLNYTIYRWLVLQYVSTRINGPSSGSLLHIL